jgi:dUTP pyrophosphatase
MDPVFKFALRQDLDISFIPTLATPMATGWDVKAAQEDRKPIILYPGQMVKIPLGFKTFCPDNFWLELRPRSSSFAKKNLHCLYGVIDEDFFGLTFLAAHYIPDINKDQRKLIIEFGEAIGQIIPKRRQNMVVEQISNEEYNELIKSKPTNRGIAGFGTTS